MFEESFDKHSTESCLSPWVSKFFEYFSYFTIFDEFYSDSRSKWINTVTCDIGDAHDVE